MSLPQPNRRLPFALAVAAVVLATATLAAPAGAYIGPGAGFALLSSFMVLFSTIVIALGSLLIWPFRTLIRALRRAKPPKASIQRLVIVGLDGQDPRITDKLMAEGKLPNFQKLARSGAYARILTTYPALSPVAWSSFSTGTNPAKHNIFDFLDRDLRTYLPKLSSTHIGRLERSPQLCPPMLARGDHPPVRQDAHTAAEREATLDPLDQRLIVPAMADEDVEGWLQRDRGCAHLLTPCPFCARSARPHSDRSR